MTEETYEKARDIIIKMRCLNGEINDIKDILRNDDVEEWLMTVRRNESHTLRKIRHNGRLRKFLTEILDDYIIEYRKLKEELDSL